MQAQLDNNAFPVGTRVHIVKERMPNSMSHFESGKDGTVTEYRHNSCQTGSMWEHNHTINIDGVGEVSWYPGAVLRRI